MKEKNWHQISVKYELASCYDYWRRNLFYFIPFSPSEPVLPKSRNPALPKLAGSAHLFYFILSSVMGLLQCCGSGLIYSGSGSRQKFRIHNNGLLHSIPTRCHLAVPALSGADDRQWSSNHFYLRWGTGTGKFWNMKWIQIYLLIRWLKLISWFLTYIF